MYLVCLSVCLQTSLTMGKEEDFEEEALKEMEEEYSKTIRRVKPSHSVAFTFSLIIISLYH